MTLELTSLENAVHQLEEALAYYHSDLVMSDAKLKKHLRAAVIQAFEFTYELSYKLIKRYLVTTSATPQAFDDMSFDAIIREASVKRLLLHELEQWRVYRKERSTTSHAYNEQKAQEVLADIPVFYEEAAYVLKQLQLRNKA
jgi:nucleotidyltransferase substrate binding protein (TIGR01987 family)